MSRLLLFALVTTAGCIPPSVGAALIHTPFQTPRMDSPSDPFEEISFQSAEGFRLRGWYFRTPKTPARALVIYLHGKDSNRGNGAKAARFFLPLGFDVLAYDARAHGASEGRYCTLGFLEKNDVKVAIDTFADGRPVFLIGESMGAATALLTAGVDDRVRGVISAAVFSDMETVVRDRAIIGSENAIVGTMKRFEEDTGVRVQDVSPMKAASSLRIPVLLVHGDDDFGTPFEHSRRVFNALPEGNKTLTHLTGVGHGDVLLHDETWRYISRWLQARAQ